MEGKAICGLAGVAAKYINEKHKKIFTELLLGASLRGLHSTGVACVFKEYNDKHPDFVFDKCVGIPWNLFERKPYDAVLNHRGAKALIGHCRHGTIGGLTRANAHPFMTDSKMMIGCHNGTLRGKLPNQEYYGTDSECLLNNIDEEGIEKVLPETSGAWALTYYDGKDETLNLIRNSERSLYIATKDKENDMFWTSEEGLLRWVLSRNDVKVGQGGYEVWQLKENTLLSVKLATDDPMATENVKITKISGKEESRTAASVTHFPGYVRWPEAQPQRAEATQTTAQPEVTSTGSSEPIKTGTLLLTDETGKKKTEPSQSTSGSVTQPITSHLTRPTFGGKRVSESMFRSILEMGCIHCERVPLSNRPVHFFADHVFLCEECNNNPDVRNLIAARIGEYIEDEYEARIVQYQ